MFRIGKVAWFSSGGFAPFLDAPDAGAGGGGALPVDGGDGTPPPDIEAGGEPPAQTTDDDEDDEDPDLSADAEVTPERFKRVTAKLAKLNRRDRSFRVERARLKELREQGITLDDLIHGNRQQQEMAREIARNPALRKLVHGDTAEEARAAKEPEPAKEPDFDEKDLPWDPDESPANRYLTNVVKENHGLKQSLRQLEARLNQMEGKDTQRTEYAEKVTWKGAIDAAAATIEDEDFRTIFKDAMTAAYQNRKSHKRTPDQIIAHYLKGRMTRRQAAAATDAAAKVTARTTPRPAPSQTAATQQRIAEANKNLPRTVAPNGTPAPAKSTKETLVDVRRRLTGVKRY